MIAELRSGRSLLRAALELALIGLVTYGVLYGVLWYFLVYIPAHPSMMEFKLAAPTPAPAPS